LPQAVPETPEELYERAKDALRVPPVEEWEAWPFEGELRPVIVTLFPREHYADPGDLADELAAELGVMIARVERAVRSVGEIGRVHVYRLGDGSEHLHWWFLARPARLPQLTTNLVAIWDDVLPPLPEELWRENLAAVKAALSETTT
jgi:diadenosine tetraphosphate (Ap4A) HIT family hydrolase